MNHSLAVATALPASASAPKQQTRFLRLRTMVQVALRMMFHDKLKLAGTLFGVIFAVVLTNQQVGVFRANVERLAVRAPIDGDVLQIKYLAGEYVTPGGGDPLVPWPGRRAG